MGFLISEMYRLELHWEKARYIVDGTCELIGARFSGPALSNAEQIAGNNNINLDFYRQYYSIVSNVYIAVLSWGDVKYNKNGSVDLSTAIVTHDTELNRVPRLKDNDYLVIDTSNHEREVHHLNPNYDTYVVNSDGNLYNFGRE